MFPYCAHAHGSALSHGAPYYHHGPGYPHYFEPYIFYWPIPYCPACSQPAHLCCCPPKRKVLLPQATWVDASNSPKQVFIGGTCDAKLSLEYMPEPGITTASVTVTITDSGGTFTWQEDPIAEGYHVKTDFSAVSPGAHVVLEVNQALARLRWCETVEC